MSELRVSQDHSSGCIIAEHDFATEHRTAAKITVTFTPSSLWMKIKCWFGFENPEPVLMEIDMLNKKEHIVSKRIKFRDRIVEEVGVIVYPGSGTLTALFDPKDFNRRWMVHIKMEALNN